MLHMGCKDAVNICLRRTAADMSGCAFRHDSVSDIKTISISKKMVQEWKDVAVNIWQKKGEGFQLLCILIFGI